MLVGGRVVREAVAIAAWRKGSLHRLITTLPRLGPRPRFGAVIKSSRSDAVGRAALAPWMGGGGLFGGGRSSMGRPFRFFSTNSAHAPPTILNRINAFMIRTPLFTGVAVATVKTGLVSAKCKWTTHQTKSSHEDTYFYPWPFFSLLLF